MKSVAPKSVHESYQRHRRQVTIQIVLPMVITAILFLVLIAILVNTVLLQNAGDVSRWAAVSTIWIFAPIIVVSLIFLALLAGMIYLLARLLGIAPIYTGKAQDFVRMVGARIQQAADIPVKPVLFLDSVGATIKAIFSRK